MLTNQRVISIVVDGDLQRRVREAAAREGKSVSRLIRELVEERLRPASPQRGRRSALRKLSGLACGELVIADLDRELYEDER